MPRASSTQDGSSGGRAALQARLQSRREEIEEAVMTRVFAVAGAAQECDAEYVDGVKTAVAAAVDYGLAAVSLGELRSPPPPPALLAQARLAARHGVSLDIVLRRYFGGHVVLADFLVEEAERDGALSGPELQGLLRSQAALLERIVAAVSEEHGRESAARFSTAEERRASRVERLLAGELVETSEFPYEFEDQHVGLIARGPGCGEAVRDLARSLDRRLLVVCRNGLLWAWLGGRRATDPAELKHRAARAVPPQVSIAIGEPADGLIGWRLTHRQARAALPIALRGEEPVVRYADVALLAAVLQDRLLATSLHELYIQPLNSERNGGEVLRETVRAYFAAGGNASSAASFLGVKRQTVTNRLRTIEGRLGRELSTCAAEMEAALRLEELTSGQTERSDLSKSDTSSAHASALVGEVT